MGLELSRAKPSVLPNGEYSCICTGAAPANLLAGHPSTSCSSRNYGCPIPSDAPWRASFSVLQLWGVPCHVVDPGGVSQVPPGAYGNPLEWVVFAAGTTHAVPMAGTDFTHTHTLHPDAQTNVAMLVEAAGFLIQLPTVTPPHTVGASSTVTHQRPFSSHAVMLSINRRQRLLPPHSAAWGAGATSASPPLPALHHAVAFPSSRLPLAAPGRAEELQQKHSQRRGPTAAARLGVPPPRTLPQPLQGGSQGAPTSEPPP